MSAVGSEPYSNNDLYVAFSVCLAISTLSCAVRFFVRGCMTRRAFLLDDYLILAAWVVFALSDSLQIYMVSNKVLNLAEASLDQIVADLKIIFFLGFSYVAGLWLIKFSLLAFYIMVFSRPEIKLFIRLTAVYLVISLIGCYLAQLLYCRPVNSFWNPLLAAQDCHDGDAVNIVYCVLTVTSDAMVLAIPIWSLGQLRINIRKKLTLYLLFAAGGFAIIASIMRMVMSLVQSQHVSPIILWGTVEETVGFLVANAPAVRVLFFKGHSFESTSGTSMHATAGQYSRHERSRVIIPDQDDFEMVPKGANSGGFVSVVTTPRTGVPKGDLKGVLKSVEFNVQSEDVKTVDESSSTRSSEWAG